MNYSFSFWSDAWSRSHRASVRDNSAEEYYKVVVLLNREFGDQDVRSITPGRMQDYLDSLHDQGKAKSTINKRRLVLQMIFRYILLQECGPKVQNPYGLIHTSRTAKVTVRRSLTEIEMQAIIKNRCISMIAFYAFCLLFLGMRRSELLGLMWDDLDLDTGMLHLRRVVIYKHNRPHVVDLLKNGSRERIVPIPDILLVELRVIGKGKNGYLFLDESGELPSESRLRRLWGKYCTEIGTPDITQHMERHAYATILYESDVKLKDAAAILGHKTERLTSEIYTHISQGKAALDAVKKINKYLLSSNL